MEQQLEFIRTINGDIEPSAMGITFSHEHVVIDQCFVTDHYPEFLLNDIEKISQELESVKSLGTNTLIDCMPIGTGRNPLLLSAIATKTGMNILGCTGLHLAQYYPQNHWQFDIKLEQLTQKFIDDITIGIDQFDENGVNQVRTNKKAGFIKLATLSGPFTDHEKLIFEAVAQAHLATGAPILTHTENGTMALEQAQLFDKLGVDLNQVVLSHTDRNKDLGYQQAIFETGVSVEWDSHFRWKNEEDNWTYSLLERFLPEYPHQITVGMDIARNTYWKSYGGEPGLDYLLTHFKEQLKNRKLLGYFDNLFIKNPAKIFKFKSNTQNT